KEFSFLFVLDFINFFIYTIVVFFSLYIIHFFLKRRRDEIALYKLLGLNRMNILQIFFIENCLIIIIAFFLSIILGVFFSRFALMILSSFMNLAIKSFPLMISWKIITSLTIFLAVIFTIINILP